MHRRRRGDAPPRSCILAEEPDFLFLEIVFFAYAHFCRY